MTDDWQKYLTEEERGWLHWAERRRKAGRLMVALRRLAEARAREGELVAALETIRQITRRPQLADLEESVSSITTIKDLARAALGEKEG